MPRLKRFIAITVTTSFLAAAPAKVAMPQALKKEPSIENIMADYTVPRDPKKAAADAITALGNYYVTGEAGENNKWIQTLKTFLIPGSRFYRSFFKSYYAARKRDPTAKKMWDQCVVSVRDQKKDETYTPTEAEFITFVRKTFIRAYVEARKDKKKNPVVNALWEECKKELRQSKKNRKYVPSESEFLKFVKGSMVSTATAKAALGGSRVAIEKIARNRKPLQRLIQTKGAEMERLLLSQMSELKVQGKKKFAEYFAKQMQTITPFMYSIDSSFQETEAWRKAASRLILRRFLLGTVSWYDPQAKGWKGNKDLYTLLSQLYGKDFKKIAAAARTAPKNGDMAKYLKFVKDNLGDVSKPGLLSKPPDARLLIAAAVYLRQIKEDPTRPGKNLPIADLDLTPLLGGVPTVKAPGKTAAAKAPQPTQAEKNLYFDKLQNCFNASRNQTIAKISLDMMYQKSSSIGQYAKNNGARATAILFNMLNAHKNFQEFFSGLASSIGKGMAYGKLYFYLHTKRAPLTERSPKDHLSTARVVMRAYFRQWAKDSHPLKKELRQIGKVNKRGEPIVDGKPLDSRDVLHLALIARRYSLRNAGKTRYDIPEWKKPKVKARPKTPGPRTQKEAEPLIQVK